MILLTLFLLEGKGQPRCQGLLGIFYNFFYIPRNIKIYKKSLERPWGRGWGEGKERFAHTPFEHFYSRNNKYISMKFSEN